jgi:hypothetical protein
LQTLGKQEKTPNKNPAKKHQKAQVQAQDWVRNNKQHTVKKGTSNNHPPKNKALSIAIAETQTCKLQQHKQANKNNENMQIKNQCHEKSKHGLVN